MLNDGLLVGIWAPRIRENNVKGAMWSIWRETDYVSYLAVTKYLELRTLLIFLVFCGMILLILTIFRIHKEQVEKWQEEIRELRALDASNEEANALLHNARYLLQPTHDN